MLDLHDLHFGSTPEDELRSCANFAERWHADRLDPVVLAHLRATTPG